MCGWNVIEYIEYYHEYCLCIAGSVTIVVCRSGLHDAACHWQQQDTTMEK